jgi:hypothetical protein
VYRAIYRHTGLSTVIADKHCNSAYKRRAGMLSSEHVCFPLRAASQPASGDSKLAHEHSQFMLTVTPEVTIETD